MYYQVSHTTTFEKDLKKFKRNKQQMREIRLAIEEIEKNPLCGKPMEGNFSSYFNFSVGKTPELRILYVVYSCCPLDSKEQELCRFEDEIEDFERSSLMTCVGLIQFVFVRTREACNNLYSQKRTYTESYLLE